MAILTSDVEKYVSSLAPVATQQHTDLYFNVTRMPKLDLHHDEFPLVPELPVFVPTAYPFPTASLASQTVKSDPSGKVNYVHISKKADMKAFVLAIMSEDEAPKEINYAIDENPREWLMFQISKSGLWFDYINIMATLVEHHAGDAILTYFKRLSEDANIEIEEGAEGKFFQLERYAKSFMRLALDNASMLAPTTTTLKGKPEKPNEVYRTFMPALAWLDTNGYIDAASTRLDIADSQSLPYGELDAPDWEDRMSGEIEPFEKMIVPNSDIELDELTPDDLDIMAKCNWSKDQLEEFYQAQGMFDNGDGPEDEWFEHDIAIPMWMQIQIDNQVSDEIAELREEAFPYIQAIRQHLKNLIRYFMHPKRDQWFKDMVIKDTLTFADREKWADMMAHDRINAKVKGKTQSDISELVEWFESAANNGANILDLAVIIMSVEDLIDTDYFKSIRIDGITLADFIEENEDVVIDAMADGGLAIKSTDRDLIDLFSETTLTQLIARQSVPDSEKAALTPEFMSGQLNAIIEGASIEASKSIGYEEFRSRKSTAGNLAFHAKFSGENYKEAMIAFWQVFKKKEKKRDVIVSVLVNGKGLQLSSNRIIDWRIAKMKLEADEIDHGQVDKLTTMLKEHGMI